LITPASMAKGKPQITDAMEILKKMAGMKNKLSTK
jgi:hypothetical protein